MINQLQEQINNTVAELDKVNKQIAKYGARIDKAIEKICIKQNINFTYLDIVKTYEKDNKYYLCYNTVNDEIKITKPLYQNIGKIGLLFIAKHGNEKHLDKLKQEYTELAKDVLSRPQKTVTLNVEKKKLNIIDLINDNTVFQFTIMNSNNSLPLFKKMANDKGKCFYTNENILHLENNMVHIGNFMLDLCSYDLFSNDENKKDNFLSEYWETLHVENNFFNKYRKEFCRLSLVFADKPIYFYDSLMTEKEKQNLIEKATKEKTEIINVSDKTEIFNKSKNYIDRTFTPWVKKTWLAVNNIALKKYKAIQADENKKGEFLTDCIVETSVDEILDNLGIVKNRDNDTFNRNQVETSLHVLEFCKLQATKWIEGVGEQEVKKLLKQTEKGQALDFNKIEKNTKPIFDTLKNFNPKYDSSITNPDLFGQGRIHKRGFINVISKGVVDNAGHVTLYFSNTYLNYIVKQNNFEITSNLLSIDSRNPNAWSLGVRLAQLLYMQTNSITTKEKIEERKKKDISKKNNNLNSCPKKRTVAIERLLPYTTIPNKDQVKLYHARKYRTYIITPILTALEVLREWHNLNYELINPATKKKIPLEVAKKVKIDDFIKLQVRYNFFIESEKK
jgi:hypothetical protein